MRITKLLVLLLAVFVLTNCSKDETPAPKPDTKEEPKPEESDIINYFTAEIAQEKDTERSDDYLIIHDANGKLIDFKPFEKGETIKFNAHQDSITDSFTVTQFFLRSGNEPSNYYLQSYSDIEKGSSWKIRVFDGSNSVNSETTGRFHIKITGDSEKPDAFLISNENGLNLEPIKVYNGFEDENWNFAYYMNKENNFKDYMITSLTPTGSSKYYLFENVENDDAYEISYDDFANFDAYIDFSSPSPGRTTIKLIGHKTENIVLGSGWDPVLGNGYNLYNLNLYSTFEANTEALQLGYLENTFEAYSFYVAYHNDFYYSKKYFGKNPPSSFRVPEKPESTILNSDLKNFDIAMPLDYVRSISQWTKIYDGGSREGKWYIYAAPNSYPTLGEFPKELSTKYPYVELDQLEYKSTSFQLDSYSHPEFIEKTFVTQDIETIPRNKETITLYSE